MVQATRLHIGAVIKELKDGKKDGFWEVYFNNGQLHFSGNYKIGKLDGFWQWYHKNGQLETKGNYNNGKKDGFWESFYPNGQFGGKGNFKDGKEDGLLIHADNYCLAAPLFYSNNEHFSGNSATTPYSV